MALKILGISGSLRKASVNSGLLRIAAASATPVADVKIADISNLPLFNEDLEKNLPPAVTAFRNQVAVADAIVFACPENNFSVSAALKNSLDWASRKYGDEKPPLSGKPVAIMGAGGGAGTARAQIALRQILVFLDCPTVNQPFVGIARWGPQGDKFDVDGNTTDPQVLTSVKGLVDALIKLTIQCKK